MEHTPSNQPDDDSAFLTANSQANSHQPVQPRGDHAENNGGNYTLQPFVFPRKRRSSFRGRRGGARNSNLRNTDNVTPNDIRPSFQYKRFLTIKANDEGTDLRKINTIRAYEELKTSLGEIPEGLSETRKGTIIFESKSERTTNEAKKIKLLAGVPVTIGEHDRLNETRGTIWYANHPNYSEEEILAALQKYGVKSVYRTKQKRDNILVPSSIYILTFNHCNLPESVLLGWTKCSVRLYIPRPRRCYKCQGFGHGANTCRQLAGRCSNCSLEMHELPCTRDAKCANCGGNHPATSTTCPVYCTEQEILATQAKECISYIDAKKKVRNTYVRPQVTFATITATQPTASTAGPKQNNGPNDSKKTSSYVCRTASRPTTTDDIEHAATTVLNEDPQPLCVIPPGSTVVPLQSRKRSQEHSVSPVQAVRPKIPRKPSYDTGSAEDQCSTTTTTFRRSRSYERQRNFKIPPETKHKKQIPSKQIPPNIKLSSWEDQRAHEDVSPIPTVISGGIADHPK